LNAKKSNILLSFWLPTYMEIWWFFSNLKNLKTDYISSFLKIKFLFSEILGGRKNCFGKHYKVATIV
jgi:hypothetical protein